MFCKQRLCTQTLGNVSEFMDLCTEYRGSRKWTFSITSHWLRAGFLWAPQRDYWIKQSVKTIPCTSILQNNASGVKLVSNVWYFRLLKTHASISKHRIFLHTEGWRRCCNVGMDHHIESINSKWVHVRCTIKVPRLPAFITLMGSKTWQQDVSKNYCMKNMQGPVYHILKVCPITQSFKITGTLFPWMRDK